MEPPYVGLLQASRFLGTTAIIWNPPTHSTTLLRVIPVVFIYDFCQWSLV